MMPTYGSDLKKHLFSPNVDEYVDDIFHEAVTSATEMWMSEVTIYEVSVDRNINDYPNQATINISFSIKDIPESQEELTLEIYA